MAETTTPAAVSMPGCGIQRADQIILQREGNHINTSKPVVIDGCFISPRTMHAKPLIWYDDSPANVRALLARNYGTITGEKHGKHSTVFDLAQANIENSQPCAVWFKDWNRETFTLSRTSVQAVQVIFLAKGNGWMTFGVENTYEAASITGPKKHTNLGMFSCKISFAFDSSGRQTNRIDDIYGEAEKLTGVPATFFADHAVMVLRASSEYSDTDSQLVSYNTAILMVDVSDYHDVITHLNNYTVHNIDDDDAVVMTPSFAELLVRAVAIFGIVSDIKNGITTEEDDVDEDDDDAAATIE